MTTEKIFILHHIPAESRKISLQEDLNMVALKYPIEWVEKFLPEDIDSNITQQSGVKIGELSLLLKHQYVFEQIVQQKITYGIILEDDVDLLSVVDVQQFFEQSISEIKEASRDFLWIGDAWKGKYTIPQEFKQPNKLSYFSENCCSRCTHAYIISLNGAKLMLEEFNYEQAIDHLFNSVKLKRSVTLGWTEPGLLQKSAEGKWSALL